MMLNTFSYTYLPSAYLLWWGVHTDLLSILNWLICFSLLSFKNSLYILDTSQFSVTYLFWYYVYYKIDLCMWRNENNYRKVWSRKWICSITLCCSPFPQTPDHMCMHDGFGGWLLDEIGDTELSKFHSSGRQSNYSQKSRLQCSSGDGSKGKSVLIFVLAGPTLRGSDTHTVTAIQTLANVQLTSVEVKFDTV